MQVDPQQLVDNGFITIKECIPSYQLDELRNSFEELVERQKSIWASDRKPTDPPGGFGKFQHSHVCLLAHSLIQQPLMQLSFVYMKIPWALVPR